MEYTILWVFNSPTTQLPVLPFRGLLLDIRQWRHFHFNLIRTSIIDFDLSTGSLLYTTVHENARLVQGLLV